MSIRQVSVGILFSTNALREKSSTALMMKKASTQEIEVFILYIRAHRPADSLVFVYCLLVLLCMCGSFFHFLFLGLHPANPKECKPKMRTRRCPSLFPWWFGILLNKYYKPARIISIQTP